MKPKDIIAARLMSQQVLRQQFNSAPACVAYMGALQAQDFNMAKWAVGMRTKNATLTSVNKALDKGEIIRTHVLRPTWHLVAAKDVYWLLDLTAQHIINNMRSRLRELELTDKLLAKSNKLFEKELDKNGHLTREELTLALSKAKIPTNDMRASHIFLYAELCKVICSGPAKGLKNTYALLEKRAHHTKELKREEAVAKLAKIYFTSHGPATISDFAWWSSLPLKEISAALNELKKDLASETMGEQTLWSGHDVQAHAEKKQNLFLLPAYDEFIISYKDRSAAISLEHHHKAISNNGIFSPTILINGSVAGTWKRSIQKEEVLVAPDLFIAVKPAINKLLKKSAEEYAAFLNKELKLV